MDIKGAYSFGYSCLTVFVSSLEIIFVRFYSKNKAATGTFVHNAQYKNPLMSKTDDCSRYYLVFKQFT